MLGLMEYVLCAKDDADNTMTAFRKQIKHWAAGISVVQHVVQYE